MRCDGRECIGIRSRLRNGESQVLVRSCFIKSSSTVTPMESHVSGVLRQISTWHMWLHDILSHHLNFVMKIAASSVQFYKSLFVKIKASLNLHLMLSFKFQ